MDGTEKDPEKRKELLRNIILELHDGATVEEVKAKFVDAVRDVSHQEVAQMEQDLIEEGMPVEEVKKLCDAHAAVFKEALEAQNTPDMTPGHPAHTLKLENQAILSAVNAMRAALQFHDQEGQSPGPENQKTGGQWIKALEELPSLREVEKHYLRKENILFPYLEKYGFYGPSKVMWAIHDDIRAALKELDASLRNGTAPDLEKTEEALESMAQMVGKEENILLPNLLEKLTEEEWVDVLAQETQIGYTLIQPGSEWKPSEKDPSAVGVSLTDNASPVPKAPPFCDEDDPCGGSEDKKEGAEDIEEKIETTIDLQTGKLTPEQVNLVLRHLPFDITYVDETNRVKYYSEGDRIFPRTPAIIGREVQNCHPPASVHIVERIVNEFKAGTKDVAEFWLPMNDMLVHIRYFAVRDDNGKYRGVVEVSQNIAPLKKIEGMKRLLDWE